MLKCRFRAESGVYEGTVRDDGYYADGKQFNPEDVELLSPCTPSKIIAAGMNSGEHHSNIIDEEYQKPEFPTFFFEAPSSVIPSGGKIVKHETVDFLDYEGEIAIVIGEECKRVAEAEALEYVEGYTCFNDVSARDWNVLEAQWARAKSMDTFSPLGPYLQTEIDLPLSLETRVNDKVRQRADTTAFFYDVPELVSIASEFFTLHPGDVIATGTVPGTAGEAVEHEEWSTAVPELALDPGDVVEVEVEGVGVLRNEVAHF